MPKSNESTAKLNDTPATSTRLIDEITAEQPRYKRGTKIDRIIEALEGQDREDFIAALRDKSISNVVIVRVMKRRGFDISESGISTYRSQIYVTE
jgi:hypothetical protein